MEEESRQVIERLAEAVDSHNATLEQLIEAVNGPDWWVIGITIVNAAIMAWLGWRQYLLQRQQTKLQEQQNHQQEYALYRRMYIQVENTDTFALTLLQKIAQGVCNMADKMGRLSLLDKIISELEGQTKEFDECSFDLELKQCGNVADIVCYYKIISESRNITQMIRYLIMSDKMTYTNSSNNISNINITTNNDVLVDIIVDYCNDKEYKVGLSLRLRNYVRLLQNIENQTLKNAIKERIIPTNTK